jgi:hypothetical protein
MLAPAASRNAEGTNATTSAPSHTRYTAAAATHPTAPQPTIPAPPGTGHTAFHTDRNAAADVPPTKHADSLPGGESESSAASDGQNVPLWELREPIGVSGVAIGEAINAAAHSRDPTPP